MPSCDHTPIRIIDANFNRAREALRVMEDFARFGLEDAGLASSLKDARHALSTCIRSAERRRGSAVRSPNAPTVAGFMHDREIVSDVGRDIRTPPEYDRTDLGAVAVAAGKRLSEALRSIEEYGKIIDPEMAIVVERLRYKGYDLERRLVLTTQARRRLDQFRLYVLLTEALCHADWFTTAQAVLRGGADALQLREKSLPDGILLDRAKKLSSLCRDHQALFFVNDRPDIAALSQADGVHLGQDDLSVSDARRMLPASCLVGISTHTVEQATRAAIDAPDYIAVGPMFASATKPQSHIAGPSILAAVRTTTGLPLVAIGGIHGMNVGEVLSAAPCCLCVCSDVIGKVDASQAVKALREQMERHAAGPSRSRF